jgi:uncharacterized protein (TIGR00369 family)
MSSVEVPEPEGFAGYIGVKWVSMDPNEARGTVEVQDHHKQPYGIVHGGVYASLAESLCSTATHVAVSGDGMLSMGQANDTSFLRPITGGTITATARARTRGSTTWVWDVEITDDEGRLCALVRMTIAVRPRRD